MDYSNFPSSPTLSQSERAEMVVATMTAAIQDFSVGCERSMVAIRDLGDQLLTIAAHECLDNVIGPALSAALHCEVCGRAIRFHRGKIPRRCRCGGKLQYAKIFWEENRRHLNRP